MKVIAFDLDGTIIDSEEGITNCIRYVLDHFQMEHPAQEELLCFIGPPLKGQFQKVFGFDEAKALEGVHKFRERFDKIGLYECKLYPGIRELIQNLHAEGIKIALASSKHEDACVRILEHHKLDSYFDQITGATRDGRVSAKKQVLEELCRRMEILPEDLILIGDTRFDVIGAREAGVHSIGVTYGFGSREELAEAGADQICDNTLEVWDYLAKINFS